MKGANGERVWVTGVGLVTALGGDADATWSRLVKGERGFAPLDLFEAGGQRSTMVASVRGSRERMPPGADGDSSKWSRTSAFAWKAASEAMAAAGLLARAPGAHAAHAAHAAHERARSRPRVGLIVGSTTGGMFETETLLADLYVSPNRTESLVEMISQPLTATGDRLGEALGPFERVRTLCSACSSGANPFAVGAIWLLSGVVDAVVVGGTDGLCRLTLSGFNALAATDPDRCRPFDARRKGLNLGEGAGFAVLECSSRVRDRGGEAIAELAGWAVGAEAHHITNPEPSGAAAARVIRRCLKRAGLTPRDVDYVNAHGTGTPLNDAMESSGLRLALGAEADRIPVSSSKGQVGHMLGAAGAVEAIFSALTVKEQVILPTMGLEEPDEACKLVHVMHEARRGRVRATLSSSFGFGGMDTVLLLTEPELGPPPPYGARRVVVTGAAALTARGLEDERTAVALADGSADAEPAARAGQVSLDLGSHLEIARARRLDRPARLGAVAAERALCRAEVAAAPLDRAEVGIVLGTAFGSLDPSAAFMHRVFDKGARFASPAEFPNLVPSSPVGHVSIYLGLRGAALATADLATSGESAVMQSIELIASGDEDALVAGAVEEASELVERILFTLHEQAEGPSLSRTRRPRSEGAATLVLEAESHARERGKHPLATLDIVAAFTDAPASAWPEPRNAARARVVSTHGDPAIAALLAATGWAKVPWTFVAQSAGEHEGLGATALVAATALVSQDRADEVLVLGLAKGRGYAFLVRRPEPATSAAAVR